MGASWVRNSRFYWGTITLLGVYISCVPDFDTTRRPAPIGTVGSEIFNALCERVHTGETPSDLTFDRGRTTCTQGLAAAATAPQGVGVKTTALARMRTDVVTSLDRAMPRDTYTPLDRLLVDLLPLYGPDGSNRTDAMRRSLVITPDGGTALSEDLLPQTTRAVASLMTQIGSNQEALGALERMSLRQGYRPVRVAFGLLRPVLGYQRIDDLLDTTFRLFRDPNAVSPAGTANAQFQVLLATLRGEMADARPATPEESVGGTTLDALNALMFREDEAFGAGQPIDIVRRNACGFAQTAGAVVAPFVDTNRDGAVDTVRCVPVDAMRQPLRNAPTPFPARGAGETARDAAGRSTAYRYIDLNRSMLGATARQLSPLLAGTEPRALQILHGAQALFGARTTASRMYSSGSVSFQQFTAEASPVVDLAHALGVLLSHRDAPALLSMTRQLMTGANEQRTARLLGAVLAVKAISDRSPSVTMNSRATIWDDVMATLRRIAAEPGLLEDILEATADMTRPLPATGLWESSCQATVPAQNLSRAFAGYASNRDRIEPDWTDARQVDGFPAWNQPVIRTLNTAVNRTRPDTQDWMNRGSATDNRSSQARLFHLVDDLSGARMCNKDHAAVRIRFNVPLLGERSVGVPGATDIAACRLVDVPDSATFYLRTVVGGSRGILPLTLPGLAGTVTDIARTFGVSLDSTLDGLVQSQSQIHGFGTEPTPFAVARLVFNPTPNAFLRDLVDPVLIRNSDGVNAATNPEFVVRNYHRGTLFAWESYCFYDSMRPLALAFVRHDRHRTDNRLDPRLAAGADPATMAPALIDSSRGAGLFVELFDKFHKHWASDMSGDFQSRTACVTCREGRNAGALSGASRYEPILSEVLTGDLMMALGELTTALRSIDPGAGTVCADRTRPGQLRRCTGIDMTATLVRALVMPDAPGLNGTPAFASPPATRTGATRTLFEDTTTPTDVTLYTLFAAGFNAMNPLLDANAMQRANWDAARSAIVDQFLTVDGSGTSAQFRNRAFAPITRATVDWLIERLAAHRTAGDFERWARDSTVGLSGRLANVVRGPAFASGVDLGLSIWNDRDARVVLGALMTWLLSESQTVGDSARTGSNFATTLSSLGDLLQVVRADQDIDPFLHVLAPAMVPSTGTTALSLRFLDRSRAYDNDRVLTRVLANMTLRPEGDSLGREPLSVLGDAISDTHRQTPGNHDSMSAMDFSLMFRAVAEFFNDRRRGLEQFYSILQQRRLPQ
jgi:hypothetical protein